jgi:phosphate transport system substrate-binding protein
MAKFFSKKIFSDNPLVAILVNAPILAQTVTFVSFVLIELLYFKIAPEVKASLTVAFVFSFYIFPLPIIFYLSYSHSKKIEIEDNFKKTYSALLFPIITLLVAINAYYYIFILEGATIGGAAAEFFGVLFVVPIFVMCLPFIVTTIAMISGYQPILYLLYYFFCVYFAFSVGFSFGLFKKKHTIANKKPVMISLSIILILFLIFSIQALYRNSYLISNTVEKMQSITEESIHFRLYGRYGVNEETTIALRGVSEIRFENNFPKLGGAIALCPIYFSAAKAIYAKPDDYLHCSGSAIAYERLVEGKSHLIFALAPSEEQLKLAQAAGIEFALTPIGREAFVFLVNENNPIKNLSIEQIRKIYTGEIENWRDVGGSHTKILAFQRNENSGSQTEMENRVMKGLIFKKAPRVTVQSMDGLIDEIADYRNAENAIGYSFRYFVTDMHKAQGVRLLAIDGIEPTQENIQNGSYPLISDFYIVSRKNDTSENAQKLIDWFLSDQGQTLIKDVGYTPIKKGN